MSAQVTHLPVRQGPPLLPAALEFAPDLLAIQERPPGRYPRVLLWIVGGLVASLAAWAAFARVDIIAVAPGRLVPRGFTKLVQPAEAGVVNEILVKDGDTVHEGQLLMRLDARLSQADTAALGTDVALKRLTARGIEAELAERPLVAHTDDRKDLFAQVDAQFQARRRAYLDALAQETESLNKVRADLQAAQQVLEKLRLTLPAYRQSADAYRKLVQEGYVGELAATEKAREAVEREQDLKTQAAQVESLHASIALGTKRVAALRSQYRSQLENERVETLSQLNRSGQELEKASVKAGLLDVRAPHSGIIKDLAVTTRGQVVAAGMPLMNIVPLDQPLQAEVLLRNEDAGFVSVGQAARVKVAAYPFQKYGMLEGSVELIGADTVPPKGSSSEAVEPAYRATVGIPSALVSAATGERLALTPGMQISAEIHQGSRTVIEYLLSPMMKTLQEAARER